MLDELEERVALFCGHLRLHLAHVELERRPTVMNGAELSAIQSRTRPIAERKRVASSSSGLRRADSWL